jgi:crotonobetainyl-CoA:carnitine CoA-transferase CaiB-like acyl-CoA transferase
MRKILPLQGRRIVSLSLNLPGPAALLRCQAMGARCVKVEPPGGDPMQHYRAEAYAEMHQGIRVLSADLKQPTGQQRLQRELSQADVLLTSFRPSALAKLGLDWKRLHKAYPQLCQVAIVGAAGERAEEPGHDLTYQAEHDLVTGLELPASLFADMGGALMASEAALKAVLQQKISGRGSLHEVALSDAAAWLALPRQWQMTTPDGPVGGAHAGYGLYPCRDGRVAVAALEPHFAQRLCEAASVPISHPVKDLFKPEVAQAIARFLSGQTRKQLTALSEAKDIPLLTLR